MPYQLVTAPEKEPVSVDEAANFLRIDDDLRADDELLQHVLIPAARRHAEHLTNRVLITQTWQLLLDGWPACGIELERCPVQAVTQVETLDDAGAWGTVAPSVYAADFASAPARLAPRFGQYWPAASWTMGSVRITFRAGYGDAPEDVPEGIRSWMLMRINSLWQFRGESEALLVGRLEKPAFVDGMLDPYKVIA